MESNPHQSAVLNIWNANYPFDYWDNRIAKLNPHNSQDALDALFVLSHLTDIYVTVLTAKLRQPDFLWYTITDDTRIWDIENVLDELEGEKNGQDFYFIENILNQSENLIEIEPVGEWGDNLDPTTALVNQILGCPADFDEENKEISLYYEPEMYLAVSNAIVNYWAQNRGLLNDFKHGFRVLPFNWETVDYLISEGPAESQSLDEIRQDYEEIDADWAFDFWKMEVGEEDNSVIPITLAVYTADVSRCKALSRLVLKLLYNLIDNQLALHISEEVDSIFHGSSDGMVPILHRQYSFNTKIEKENK
jgi:hypothetical protein